MEAKAQLENLVRIQELSFEVRSAHETVENAPRKVEQIEANFRERNAEFVAIQEQNEELEQDQKTRTAAVAQLEEQLKKFQSGLMEVKNQREYAAMLKEIDAVKAEIADNEEAILKDMEGLERLKTDLEVHSEHIQQERVIVAKERSAVEQEAGEARSKIETLSVERESLESALPPSMVATIKRLESTRHGIFLTKAENGSCGSCFVRIRPQVFQEVKLAIKVHTCSNCRRYLYSEKLLIPAASEPQASVDSSEEPGVERSDGGTV